VAISSCRQSSRPSQCCNCALGNLSSQDILGSPKEIERAIQKRISALEALLTDSDPHVHVAGSEATARVLGTYWAVLSLTDIRLLLNRKYTSF
jgi:hypothetical protein